MSVSLPLKPQRDVLSRKIRDLVLLLDLKQKQYVSFNEVGSRMWEVVQDSSSIEEALKILLNDYQIDQAQLRTDLEQFVDSCLERGLLVTSSGNAED